MIKNKYPIVTLLLGWSLIPIIWQIYTSFCTPEALIKPFGDIHNRWTLDNYIDLLSSDPPFMIYLLNSFIVASLTTLSTILIAIPASYSITRISKKARNLIRLVLITAALFPYVLLFLALLELARHLNLGNNLLALSIPYTGLSLPLALLILTSAFNDLPKDLDEASKLEGLNVLQRLRWVLIPLIAPATASTSILVFLFSWNEYPIALTWISRSELLTLPVAIARIAGSSIYSVPYGAYAAATVLGSLPLVILMIIFQRQIISGLTQGAIKG